MSKSYYNVKKCRDLKKKQIESVSTSNDAITLDNDNIQQCDKYLLELSQPSEEIFNDLYSHDSNNDNNDNDNNNDCDSDINNSNSKSDNNASRNSNIDIDNSDSDNEENEIEERIEPINLESKIRSWAQENIATLNNKAISEMLCIWRSEGYVNLLKTAEALLQTQ